MSEYDTKLIAYSDLRPDLVERMEIDGVPVDIVRHVRAIAATAADTPTVTPYLFEAIRADSGPYTLMSPSCTFYINAGRHHPAGTRAGSQPSRLEDTELSLGTAGTLRGVRAGARRNYATRTAIARHGDAARAAVRTWTSADFATLDPGAHIEPGDVVVGWGRDNFRQGIATRVTRTKVFYLFSTPTGQGHLSTRSDRIGNVRLVRKATPPTIQPAGPIQVNVAQVNAKLAARGHPARFDPDNMPAGSVPMQPLSAGKFQTGQYRDGRPHMVTILVVEDEVASLLTDPQILAAVERIARSERSTAINLEPVDLAGLD